MTNSSGVTTREYERRGLLTKLRWVTRRLRTDDLRLVVAAAGTSDAKPGETEKGGSADAASDYLEWSRGGFR